MYRLANCQPTGAHGQAQSNSMFSAAFPLPQEQGGTTPPPRALFPRAAPSVGGCEYHTAIPAAFQLVLPTSASGLTEPACKVQTCLDLRSPRRTRGSQVYCFVIFRSSLDVSSPNARSYRGIRGPSQPALANKLAEKILCSILSQSQRLWSCPPILVRKPRN
jgi:hypothetical protein